jgi:hypothetical protein
MIVRAEEVSFFNDLYLRNPCHEAVISLGKGKGNVGVRLNTPCTSVRGNSN